MVIELNDCMLKQKLLLFFNSKPHLMIHELNPYQWWKENENHFSTIGFLALSKFEGPYIAKLKLNERFHLRECFFVVVNLGPIILMGENRLRLPKICFHPSKMWCPHVPKKTKSNFESCLINYHANAGRLFVFDFVGSLMH